jgi:NAD(P)-dependent dehydrogenase (short-subunit alcohol dehydrogenase family)
MEAKTMSKSESKTSLGTVVITGPTGGLGRELALQMASRPENDRPDLLLVGRPGKNLTEITELVRKAGANAFEVSCDLSVLSNVREAAKAVIDILDSGQVRPLHAVVANAGWNSVDTRLASADGYEMTFAVNYLAHAQLIHDLKDSMVAPGRIVMVGSNTYFSNIFRRILHVPAAEWRDPIELARPAPASAAPNQHASGVAYSNSKLAILYYAHELQRHVPDGIRVIVYEPGFMPGTGLSRGLSPTLQSILRTVARLPGVSTPAKSAPKFASVVLDEKWSHLRNGDFVVKDKQAEVKPFAKSRDREQRLWQATTELLTNAKK